MIVDLTEANEKLDFAADVVVVGAGATGLTAAATINAAGKTVIILDAGGVTIDASSQRFLREARSLGRAFGGLGSGRYAGLGGTTTAWAGQLVPFDPVVFEHRPWVADMGWPFGQTELDGYYRKTANLIKANDPMVSNEAIWPAIGLERPQLDAQTAFFLTQFLRQPNLGVALYSVIASAPDLTLLAHARVTCMDASADGTVRHIVFQTPDGKTGSVNAKYAILAAGTIEITRLLLSALASGTKAPWDSPWLGKCFLDHIDANAGTVRPINRQAFHNLFDLAVVKGVKYLPRFKISQETQREEKLVGCAAHVIFDSLLKEHLANATLFIKALINGQWPKNACKMPVHVLQLGKVMLPLVVRYLRTNRLLGIGDAGIRLRLTSEQIPTVNSTICLSDQRDDAGCPLVEVRWELDGRELRSMTFLATKIRDALVRQRLADVELDEDLVAESETFLSTAEDGLHHMGGARMARNRRDGVVNQFCQVYGSSNLFVAGAAVFPVSGFENPTFTAMALSVRVAEHVAERC